jgi:hypothetical protein
MLAHQQTAFPVALLDQAEEDVVAVVHEVRVDLRLELLEVCFADEQLLLKLIFNVILRFFHHLIVAVIDGPERGGAVDGNPVLEVAALRMAECVD